MNGANLTAAQVVRITSLRYGGTLMVTNTGPATALTNGAAITLFAAAN